ncbi:MAG TPA: glycerol-3-phosphate cytidylyltransferase [Gammaproteobacteria bacterium]|jgi:glycerol-3-phosphate cytidylyltransferase|nr:glycerol-3-phosphate cytidylyltransferase [Gammaproteobacteria bacterium]
MKPYKHAITYGTFDMFHVGHLELIKRVSAYADKTTVAVSSDDFNEVKGKKTIIPFDQRAEIVQAIRYVDHVIPEHDWAQKPRDIAEHGIDVFIMGDDWRGKFDDLKSQCDVIYLPRTEGISSTKLKSALNTFSSINLEELNLAFEVLKRIKENME